MEKINTDLKKFLVRLLYLTLAMGVAGVFYAWLAPAKMYTTALPFLYPFFYGVTAFVFFVIYKASQNSFSRFINSFMVITVLKLLLFVIAIVLYALFNRQGAIPFFLAFFLFYLVYTSFEVVYFLKTLKDQKEKNGKETKIG